VVSLAGPGARHGRSERKGVGAGLGTGAGGPYLQPSKPGAPTGHVGSSVARPLRLVKLAALSWSSWPP
jgi:hypothetical protein